MIQVMCEDLALCIDIPSGTLQQWSESPECSCRCWA